MEGYVLQLPIYKVVIKERGEMRLTQKGDTIRNIGSKE